MTNQLALAMASSDELLEELQRRGLVKPCQARTLIDGRAVAQLKKACKEEALAALAENPKASIEEIAADAQMRFSCYTELRLLEVLSRGLATAAPGDKVHQFVMEAARGDYAPGSLMCTINMLALAVTPYNPDDDGYEEGDGLGR